MRCTRAHDPLCESSQLFCVWCVQHTASLIVAVCELHSITHASGIHHICALFANSSRIFGGLIRCLYELRRCTKPRDRAKQLELASWILVTRQIIFMAVSEEQAQIRASSDLKALLVAAAIADERTVLSWNNKERWDALWERLQTMRPITGLQSPLLVPLLRADAISRLARLVIDFASLGHTRPGRPLFEATVRAEAYNTANANISPPGSYLTKRGGLLSDVLVKYPITFSLTRNPRPTTMHT